jgi:hypothetical protein
MRSSASDQLDARIGGHGDLMAAGLGHADVHQLSELVEVAVALVQQARGRAVVVIHGAELLIDLRQPLHRIVGARDVIGETELRIAAQPLNIGGHAVELLCEHLRRVEHRVARGT